MTTPVHLQLTSDAVKEARVFASDAGTTLVLPTAIIESRGNPSTALTSLLWRLALATAEIEGTDTFRSFLDAEAVALIDENHRLRRLIDDIGTTVEQLTTGV